MTCKYCGNNEFVRETRDPGVGTELEGRYTHKGYVPLIIDGKKKAEIPSMVCTACGSIQHVIETELVLFDRNSLIEKIERTIVKSQLPQTRKDEAIISLRRFVKCQYKHGEKSIKKEIEDRGEDGLIEFVCKAIRVEEIIV